MGLQVKNGLVDETFDFNKDFKKEDYEKWLYEIVNKTLKKFGKSKRWDKDELMSEAWLALTESAQSFNPEYSNSFLGYAKPYINNRLKEFVSVNKYTLKARYYNIKNDQEKLDKLNLIEKQMIHEKLSHTDDESYRSLEYLVPSGESAPIDYCAQKEEFGIINSIIKNDLNNKERKAIISRFKEDASYEEIGKQLKCSSEYARVITKNALERLKYKVKNAGIKDDIN